MKKHIQTFSKGINQDISTNKYSNQNFYWAQNFRFISKDGLATGAMTNVKGTSPKVSLGSGHSIIGTCQIRDTLIMFVHSAEGGKIFIWEHETSDFEGRYKLIYTDPNLNFDINKPIRAVGRYETPSIQKIYFTDGETFFKHLNIINPEWNGVAWDKEGSNKYVQLTYDLDSLDLVSDVNFSTISMELQTGGNLKAGKIQYAYQLYNRRGSESVISPESNMVDLTNSSDTSSSSIEYKGDDIGTSINKSIEVTITSPDVLFERIRLLALEYTVFDQIPNIRIVGEYDIDGTAVTMLDSGQSIGELTLEEFRIFQKDFYPKTLDIKDNILFTANITENNYRITPEEFDTRAFRFNSTNTAKVFEGNNEFNITYTTGTLSTLPVWTHEAYNDFNSVNSPYSRDTSQETVGDVTEETLYKYNPESNKLGGYGPNISYTFTTKKVLLDEGVQNDRGYRGIYPSQTCEVSTRENYSNPQTAVGYQRDEVYRFAWVPIDKKGREGFAMWIGDIKFPNNTELPFITYTLNKTYAHILGINFKVNIPEAVKEKISGYRIVRVNRTTSDKTVVAQGIIGYLANGGPDSSDKYQMMSQASVPLIGDMYNETPSYDRVTSDITSEDVSGADRYTRSSGDNLLIEDDGEPGFNPKYIEFTSPEVTFNKNEFEESASFIEAFGVLDENDVTAISGPRNRVEYNRNQLVSDKFKGYSTGSNNKRTRTFLSTNKLYNAKEFRGNSSDPNNDTTIHELNNRTFNNKTSNLVKTESDNYRRYGLRGSFNLCTVDADADTINTNKLPLEEFYTGNNLEVVIANYKVDKGRSQYGGSSYESRTYSNYYPVSEFISNEANDLLLEKAGSTEGGPKPYIEILRGGTQLLQSSTLLISAATFSDFYIYNYGDEDLVVSSVTISALTGWSISTDPSGTIAPGATAYGKITYTGGASGMSYTSVTINSDATNISQFEFTLGVEYIVNLADTPFTSIPASDPISTDSEGYTYGGLDVFSGDTYISFFSYARSLYGNANPEDGDTIESFVFFPVETSINLELRLDQIQTYINWGWLVEDNAPNYKVSETVQSGVLAYGASYPTDLGDLYRYNSAYSSINKGKEYIAEPFDFTDQKVFDTRIIASDVKINGEYTDSWTKFKFANYIDVDSKHNAITKIITFKNNLFCFQSTAVSIVSVNEKSLIQDNSAKALTLGTGGILTRYDYVTDKSGSEFYESILASDNYLFYGDSRRKRINKLVPGKEVAISIVKGIDSTLDKLSWNTCVAGFDRGFNEVIFSIDSTTVSFSEMADAFTSSYTFNPKLMVSLGGEFFSVAETSEETPWLYGNLEIDKVGYSGNTDVDPEWDYILIGPEGTGDVLYKHNVSDPGNFYGNDEEVQDSYIELIINPEGNNVCKFDNLDLRTESTTNGVDDPDDIFYRLEASDNYQELTRELSFTMNQAAGHSGTVKRIGRVWRTPIVATTSATRMMDTYIKLILRYENTGNSFRVHDICVYYRPTKH